MLSGVRVALGVTGSIAAVRCVELIHELQRRGASVRVVMSAAARDIVSPAALTYASDGDAVTELTGDVEHLALCGRDGWADVFLLAPATANTIGKVAVGIDDTPVTTTATTAIGSGVPVVVAPAMHAPMADHPRVEANLDTLSDDLGATIVPPIIEEGKAKLASDDAIALAVARAAGERPLSGHRIGVTSGTTAEALDPVRILTTRASGRTGRAVARALYVRGAEVVLLHNDDVNVPYAEVRPVETASDLAAAAVDAVDEGLDAFIAAAAVTDFSPDRREEKIRSGESISVEFHPTPKVLARVRKADATLPIIGFKAETNADDESLVSRAREHLDRYDLAFVVANDAAVMGESDSRVFFVTEEAAEPVAGSKDAVGDAVAERVTAVLDTADGTK